MKLFEVSYMEDCEIERYLSVGEDEKSVKNREYEEIKEECDFPMCLHVKEISEIDGYKIRLEKIE